MSGQNKVSCLALLVLICIAGCKSSKTVITLNPDGSGTLVLNIDYDRATDEQRDKFRKQLGYEGFSCGFEEDRFRPLFPEPHFTINEYKFDTKKLTVYAKISFTDINRLLVKKNADILDLKGLDFSIDNSKVAFTIKTDSKGGIEAMMRKDNEALPVIREIVILNAKTKESVRFYEEKGPDTPAADWSGSLAMKGHTIERTIIKHNFAGYPVIKLDGRIHEARWSLHKTARSDWSNLDVTVEVAMPLSKGITYIGWSEPVLLSGRYVPRQETELTSTFRNMSRKFINNFSPKPKGNHFMLPLEFNFPALPASAITDSVVRLKAIRAMGGKQYKLGRIEPETKYEAGGISFKSKKAKENRLDFSIKGNVASVKRFVFHTKRGSRFTLRESSSSSSANGGSIGLRTFIPLDKGDVYVELYEPIDYVWLDIAVPEIDFENTPGKAAKSAKNTGLRKTIATELDQPLEKLDEEVFASRENMAAFFKSIPDEKLLAAVAQVVDSEYMPDTGNEQRMWYQNIVVKEVGSRKEYVKGNGKQIAEKLFSLQMYLPSAKKGLVKFLPTNLRLGSYIRDKVVATIEQGNYQVANNGYFSDGITASEREVLTKAFYAAPSPYSAGILDILLDSRNFEADFADEVLKDESLSQYLRKKALEAIFERGNIKDLSFVKQFIENSKMRWVAVPALWSLVRSVGRDNTIDVMKQRINPLFPILQDLAEYPNSQQNYAVKILDKLGN